MGYTNKDGSGAYWEVLKAIYEPMGIKVDTKTLPWARAVINIKARDSDALVGAYYHQDQDGKDYLYPKWHLSVEDNITAVYKKGAVFDWQAQGLKDLSGKRIGWIRGYDFDGGFLNHINIIKCELNNLSSGIKMLYLNRIDILLDYKASILLEAKKLKIDLNKKMVVQVAKQGDKLFVAFANTDKSKSLIQIYDKQMDQLVESGEIEAIYEKWGFGKEKFGKDRYSYK
ncbi:MAG: transporter substrate-binding domain-containing protein [Desulfobacteraceae bacterium]|nr:transporter substrate-binding domain-containing protein [Desulfobacteraceae bacterium]